MFNIENKENQNNFNAGLERNEEWRTKFNLKRGKRQKYERVISSRLIRQVKKTQVLKKLQFD